MLTFLHEPRFKLFYETPLNRSERQARLARLSQDKQQHNQSLDNEDPSNMAHLPLISPTMTMNEQQRTTTLFRSGILIRLGRVVSRARLLGDESRQAFDQHGDLPDRKLQPLLSYDDLFDSEAL
jgi:hypothetical protein